MADVGRFTGAFNWVQVPGILDPAKASLMADLDRPLATVGLALVSPGIFAYAPGAGSGNQGRQRARQRHVERKAMHNNKPLAHIIIGFIGSGKTTFARRLERETGAIRFTKDKWMVW